MHNLHNSNIVILQANIFQREREIEDPEQMQRVFVTHFPTFFDLEENGITAARNKEKKLLFRSLLQPILYILFYDSTKNIKIPTNIKVGMYSIYCSRWNPK